MPIENEKDFSEIYRLGQTVQLDLSNWILFWETSDKPSFESNTFSKRQKLRPTWGSNPRP